MSKELSAEEIKIRALTNKGKIDLIKELQEEVENLIGDDIYNLKEELKDTEYNLEIAKERNDEYEKEVDELKARLTTLEDKLDQQDPTWEDLNDEVATLKEALSGALGDIPDNWVEELLK